MRLRTAKDRLKVEHSIIEGVREILERLLAATPEIRYIIPGVIRPVRDARGGCLTVLGTTVRIYDCRGWVESLDRQTPPGLNRFI